eukprot:TRINITY_DN67566_c5_g1_i1.p1 TRINITY_DN67566_c5_g1~~TRINITY_DN67566_c5_g1_i1.p1  ORF type:complete len:207 (+),score=6.37 TRINITY_DN67566_c5_g1_i1:210-830(+)
MWGDGGTDHKITEKDCDGATALLLATQNAHFEVVQWLVQEAGAQIDDVDCFGWDAVQHAVLGPVELFKWLWSLSTTTLSGASSAHEVVDGSTDNATMLAAENGHLNCVVWLAEHAGVHHGLTWIEPLKRVVNSTETEHVANYLLGRAWYLFSLDAEGIRRLGDPGDNAQLWQLESKYHKSLIVQLVMLQPVWCCMVGLPLVLCGQQ